MGGFIAIVTVSLHQKGERGATLLPMMNANDNDPIPRHQAPTACNVLVVDDDQLVRARLVSLLKLAGYQVHSASSGAQALMILSARPCQIVITDCEMPDMDGPSLCRALRFRDSERYTYVLMLTVHNTPADILVGFGAGADDYVVKGVSTEELLARIEVGRRITHLEHSSHLRSGENRRLTVMDPLTGAYNRGFLSKYLPRELTRSRRYGHSIAILSCEIDDFKRVSDWFGHEAGDEVLQAFVSRAMNCTRESIDWIARTGGEEFVIVLPETAGEGASIVAEKVRRALADRSVQTGSGPVSATVSIGVAALASVDELATKSAVDLLAAADRCLAASRGGSNRSAGAVAAAADPDAPADSIRAKHEIN